MGEAMRFILVLIAAVALIGSANAQYVVRHIVVSACKDRIVAEQVLKKTAPECGLAVIWLDEFNAAPATDGVLTVGGYAYPPHMAPHEIMAAFAGGARPPKTTLYVPGDTFGVRGVGVVIVE